MPDLLILRQPSPPVLGDRERPAERGQQPVLEAAIGRVGPQQAEGREGLGEAGQDEFGAGAVVDVGRVDLGLEQVALGGDQEVALAALDLLAAVPRVQPEGELSRAGRRTRWSRPTGCR